MTLLSKDRHIKESFVYGGYLILKKLRRAKNKKISFYEVASELNKKGIYQYRQHFFCLMFLYACDLITFNEPYIELKEC